MIWETRWWVAIACFFIIRCVSPAAAEEQFHLFRGGDPPQTYSVNGDLLRTLETDGSFIPGGLAFDAEGRLYSSPVIRGESVSGLVDRYSPTGEALGVWAQLDQSNASENVSVFSTALEFDSNGLLYAGLNGTRDNDQIERFAADGSSLGIFAETTTDGSGGAIFDIEFDASGRLYATDRQNVEWFDTTGNNLGVFASIPTSGSANFPTELEFDSEGNLYVGTIDDRIYVFSPTGEELRQFEVPHQLFAFAISQDDLLYIGAGSPGNVNAYDPTGAFQFEFVSFEPEGVVDLVISQTIPEPYAASQFLLAVVLCAASLRRRNRAGD